MSVDISGFGVGVHLVASNTFPAGIQLSQFADDADPVDIPQIEIAGTAMGVNGDLIKWSNAVPLPVNISVIPESEDDSNLRDLLAQNQASKGRNPARDVLTLVVVLPSGLRTTYSSGYITAGPTSPSVASAGRLKTNTYNFVFENSN